MSFSLHLPLIMSRKEQEYINKFGIKYNKFWLNWAITICFGFYRIYSCGNVVGVIIVLILFFPYLFLSLISHSLLNRHHCYSYKLFPINQAAAYYYHGLILDEGNTKKSHSMAVAALQAADEFLKESKKASESFNATLPTSRFI